MKRRYVYQLYFVCGRGTDQQEDIPHGTFSSIVQVWKYINEAVEGGYADDVSVEDFDCYRQDLNPHPHDEYESIKIELV
jgi:hypothetical protein